MHRSCLFHILPCLLVFSPCLAQAAARTDGSMGPVRDLSGHFEVPQDLGTLKGQNLFHSFQRFGIQSDESATFTGQNSIRNVISRVTGDEVSAIDGKLSSRVGKADFYFINPNGVTFGQGAQIDVPAAFKVSTASEIRFPDGGVYSADLSKASTLSVEKPEAYGFLGNQSGQIVMQLASLNAKPGASIELIGRDVVLLGSKVKAEGGSVRLEAIGTGDARVPFDGASESAHGSLPVIASTIDVSGNGAGKVTLRGGEVTVNAFRRLVEFSFPHIALWL